MSHCWLSNSSFSLYVICRSNVFISLFCRDAQSEHLVQQALQDLFAAGGRTIISIAHRLSTIRHASRIAVVDSGKVVQTGTFDELQKMNGPFRELMKTQLIGDDHSSH